VSGYVLDVSVAVTAAAELIADLIILPVERWDTSSLLPRIWELRENWSARRAVWNPGKVS
jgi:hypothetical protein